MYSCDECTRGKCTAVTTRGKCTAVTNVLILQKNRMSIKTHKDSNHRSIKHKCKLCDMSFTYSCNLLRHQKLYEKKGKKFTCDICGFTSCLDIRRHKRTEHPNADKQVKCDECSKVFQSESYLNEHTKIVHRRERVNCDECEESLQAFKMTK